MAINTYSSLANAVNSFAGQVGNTEFEGQTGSFIELGEADIYRSLRSHWMVVTQDFANPAPYLLPADFLEVAIITNAGVFCPPVALEELLSGELDGTSMAWAIRGNEILFDGTPTVDTVVSYYAKLAKLRDSTTDNNLFLQNPDLFLYAALYHAMIFLRDEQRQQIWASLFKQKLDEINAAAWHAGLPKQQPLKMRTR